MTTITNEMLIAAFVLKTYEDTYLLLSEEDVQFLLEDMSHLGDASIDRRVQYLSKSGSDMVRMAIGS